MRLAYALCLSLGLLPATAIADKPAPEFELTATGRIEIGPDGGVHGLSLDDGLPASAKALIEKSVASWRFEPVQVDGRPVIASTRLTLQVDALPIGNDEYRLEIDSVRFGDPKSRSKLKAPAYPGDALRHRVGARVLLQMRLDRDGNVVAVSPYQTSLSKQGSEKVVARLRERFEQASVAAAKRWKYDPAELLDGEASGMTVMVPIIYSISDSDYPSKGWQGYVPGPITPAPWVDAKSLATTETDTLENGDTAALDSRFKLLSDVKGKAL